MKALFFIWPLLFSCTAQKEPPLDEEIIISRLVGENGAKKWSFVKSQDLQNPEADKKRPKKCQLDDEVEYMEEGFVAYRVNTKCYQYEQDQAIRWRLKEIAGKFYIDFYISKFISTEFESRALVEKITFNELVLKYLKNEEIKTEDKKGNWYTQKIAIPNDFDYTMEFKSSK